MNILCACEESQAVTIELRLLGHNAFSCDLMECSGGHPEWHIMGDVLKILNPSCQQILIGSTPTPANADCDHGVKMWQGITFYTMDGKLHIIEGKWDMIIAFPPCTHLASSGARHFEKKRADGRQREGVEFFCQFLTADCDCIAIENPVGIISGDYIVEHFPDLAEKYGLPRKPSQIIQPYEHGHHSRKATCLWLKKLPQLVPTQIVEPHIVTYNSKSGKKMTFSADYGGSDKQHGKRRSKTYTGIAKAMAQQWGG